MLLLCASRDGAHGGSQDNDVERETQMNREYVDYTTEESWRWAIACEICASVCCHEAEHGDGPCIPCHRLCAHLDLSPAMAGLQQDQGRRNPSACQTLILSNLQF